MNNDTLLNNVIDLIGILILVIVYLYVGEVPEIIVAAVFAKMRLPIPSTTIDKTAGAGAQQINK